jgi:alkanesulfonate monooxygenase SsuD/methylene tetrahydromethanopterin reductase-like flavin-dependent oxidoreductase (luciferase family)
MLARLAADVDRLSGGRLILGIGIGDEPEEFEQMGIALPGVRERQAALQETVEIVTGLWTGRPFTYVGEYFRVTNAILPVGTVQQPHVPLMIAGGGERVTLRQVAQYADMSNFGAGPMTGEANTLDDVRRKLEVLRRHCDAIGRSYDEILRSHISFPVVTGTGDEAIDYYLGLAEAGIQYFIVAIRPDDPETFRLLAERVMPTVQLS